MILEPILDAAFVKVVLKIAGEGHYTLFWLELPQANTTLVLVGETLGIPIDLEHFFQHLCGLASLGLRALVPLKTLVEKVGDEACEDYCAQDKHYRRESADDQSHMID